MQSSPAAPSSSSSSSVSPASAAIPRPPPRRILLRKVPVDSSDAVSDCISTAVLQILSSAGATQHSCEAVVKKNLAALIPSLRVARTEKSSAAGCAPAAECPAAAPMTPPSPPAAAEEEPATPPRTAVEAPPAPPLTTAPTPAPPATVSGTPVVKTRLAAALKFVRSRSATPACSSASSTTPRRASVRVSTPVPSQRRGDDSSSASRDSVKKKPSAQQQPLVTVFVFMEYGFSDQHAYHGAMARLNGSPSAHVFSFKKVHLVELCSLFLRRKSSAAAVMDEIKAQCYTSFPYLNEVYAKGHFAALTRIASSLLGCTCFPPTFKIAAARADRRNPPIMSMAMAMSTPTTTTTTSQSAGAIVSDEEAELREYYQRAGSNKSWGFICKPDQGSCGKGIFLARTPNEVVGRCRSTFLASAERPRSSSSSSSSSSSLPSPVFTLTAPPLFAVQPYYANPLLASDRKKFDLRIYVLLSNKPTRFHVFRCGYARFAACPYSPPSESSSSSSTAASTATTASSAAARNASAREAFTKMQTTHLTNFSIMSKLHEGEGGFVHNTSIDDASSTKRNIHVVFAELERSIPRFRAAKVWASIERAISATLVVSLPIISLATKEPQASVASFPTFPCQHLIAFDVLLLAPQEAASADGDGGSGEDDGEDDDDDDDDDDAIPVRVLEVNTRPDFLSGDPVGGAVGVGVVAQHCLRVGAFTALHEEFLRRQKQQQQEKEAGCAAGSLDEMPKMVQLAATAEHWERYCVSVTNAETSPGVGSVVMYDLSKQHNSSEPMNDDCFGACFGAESIAVLDRLLILRNVFVKHTYLRTSSTPRPDMTASDFATFLFKCGFVAAGSFQRAQCLFSAAKKEKCRPVRPAVGGGATSPMSSPRPGCPLSSTLLSSSAPSLAAVVLAAGAAATSAVAANHNEDGGKNSAVRSQSAGGGPTKRTSTTLQFVDFVSFLLSDVAVMSTDFDGSKISSPPQSFERLLEVSEYLKTFISTCT